METLTTKKEFAYECGANEIRNILGMRIIIPEGETIRFNSGKGNNFFILSADGDHSACVRIADGWHGEVTCQKIGDINSPSVIVTNIEF